MKFKLHKSDRSKQAAIRKAIQRGLPLAGLLASAAISAGCSENKPAKVTIRGEIQATESWQHVVGDIGPVPPAPAANNETPAAQNNNQANEKDIPSATLGKPASVE